jgi:ketosteroid isomerase-like protein
VPGGDPNDEAQSIVLSGIDLQTYPGILSDTLMPGAANKSFVAIPTQVATGHKPVIKYLMAFALALAFCCQIVYAGQQKAKKHDNRHEIEQLEEAWRNAVLKSDTTALGALLSDDYIAITASGTLQTKAETLANIRNRKTHFTSLTLSDRKLRFYGMTALVTSLAQVQGTTPDGGDVYGAFRYTRVYVRDAQGQWKIVSFEASRIRPQGQRSQAK